MHPNELNQPHPADREEAPLVRVHLPMGVGWIDLPQKIAAYAMDFGITRNERRLRRMSLAKMYLNTHRKTPIA